LGLAVLFDHDLPPVKRDTEALAKVRRQGERRYRILALISAFLLLVALTFGPEPGKWFLIAVFAAVLGIPVADKLVPQSWIADRRLRTFLIIGMLLGPGMAFLAGREHAHSIKVGNAETLVDVARSQLPLALESQKPVAYLGHVGEFFLLYESATESVIVISAKEGPKLVLRRNPRYRWNPFG